MSATFTGRNQCLFLNRPRANARGYRRRENYDTENQ
ncbi:MAG: hypothetical protein HLUCCX14_07400 [Marinobacter excellens HL-55]|uniref:Uncharacterized protein n=1 Tax=Marinobacter excellens HL-55 TaxID=1305731 RepID=A0A0P8D009_9GAMM|nr:MAG: hypothetical protein HLUCCX14_07400 [Marinobacter excellens HL-55]